MKIKAMPLAGVVQAQQGASDIEGNLYPQDTPSSLPGQCEAFQGNSAASQRQRIMAHLRSYGSLTTLSARGELDWFTITGSLIQEKTLAAFLIKEMGVSALVVED